MKTAIEISDKLIRDQIESAGISYWALVLDGRFLFNIDGDVYVYELPDDEKDLAEMRTFSNWPEAYCDRHKLDFERAAQLVVAHFPRLLDRGQMDASTGDLWIQLAAFGEVKYA